MICENIGIKNGRVTFAERDVKELADKYGTPLYLMDEERIRGNCRKYLNALSEVFGTGAMPLYASKACSFRQIYRIMQDEGMGIDVVSCGEIFTAASAGFDMDRAFFHGNCKTDSDIAYAMEKGVGYFVADNLDEIGSIDAEAGRRGINQKVLIRVTPGIDTHTYEAVNTGKVDSKFGAAIETGQAQKLIAAAMKMKNISVVGLHCHVGSQVFGEDVFERAAVIMLNFIALIQKEYGCELGMLDLGGGYGVRYVEGDGQIDIGKKIFSVGKTVKETCRALGIAVPFICLEPGRSIVADAGMTVYTVGSVKEIPGYRNYVAIDGGMTDNPRFALYKSKYTVLAADKADEKTDFCCSLVGRCCESGDIIAENVLLPRLKRGDLVAVCTTGAYNFSMSSEYNRIPRPPVVMLNADGDYTAVKRQTFEDIAERDV